MSSLRQGRHEQSVSLSCLANSMSSLQPETWSVPLCATPILCLHHPWHTSQPQTPALSKHPLHSSARTQYSTPLSLHLLSHCIQHHPISNLFLFFSMLKIRTSKPPPTNRKSISPQSRGTQDSYKYTWEKIRMIWTCILRTQSVQQSYGAPFWIRLQGWTFWDPFRMTSQFLASAYPNAFCVMPHFSDPAPKKNCKHERLMLVVNSDVTMHKILMTNLCCNYNPKVVLHHKIFNTTVSSHLAILCPKCQKKTIIVGPSFCLT